LRSRELNTRIKGLLFRGTEENPEKRQSRLSASGPRSQTSYKAGSSLSRELR